MRFLVETFPEPLRPIVVGSFFVLLIFLTATLIYRLIIGATMRLPGGFAIGAPNEELAQLKMRYTTLEASFRELNVDAKRNNNALLSLHNISREIRTVLWGVDPAEPLDERLRELFRYVLTALIDVVARSRGNQSRGAVFAKDVNEDVLVILEGEGFTYDYRAPFEHP